MRQPLTLDHLSPWVSQMDQTEFFNRFFGIQDYLERHERSVLEVDLRKHGHWLGHRGLSHAAYAKNGGHLHEQTAPPKPYQLTSACTPLPKFMNATSTILEPENCKRKLLSCSICQCKAGEELQGRRKQNDHGSKIGTQQ